MSQFLIKQGLWLLLLLLRTKLSNQDNMIESRDTIEAPEEEEGTLIHLEWSLSEKVDPFLPLVIWHGNFMLFGCIVLAPVGMFVSRYFKESWSITLFCNLPLWLIVHFSYMLWAFMFMVMGMIFAKAHGAAMNREMLVDIVENSTTSNKTSEMFKDEEASHCIVGWIAFALFIVQFISGNCLPFVKEKIKGYQGTFKVIHLLLGIISNYFCIFVAMISAAMTSSQFPYFSGVVIFVWIVFVICMNIGMAYSLHQGDKELLNLNTDGPLLYYRAFLPLPVTEIEFKPKGSSFRMLLFLWYQFGAAMAFITIFIPNSQGQGYYDCKVWGFLQFDCDSFVNHTQL